MSMTREGCGDETEYGIQERAGCCECCGGRGTDCTCEPCGECAKVVDSGRLTWAADGRWRCPSCHVRRECKIVCGERPAFVDRVIDRAEDMRRTVEQPAFSMQDLVFGAVQG